MSKIFVECYIVNKNIAKVYINVIFDRRRLRQDPPPADPLLIWSRLSLCVVNNQPVGNPKRKV
jgi:hypothetical protein